MNTYEIIKELSKSKQISISELERVLGVSNGFLIKWKTRKPNPIVLEKIADYFNVSTDYLLGRTENTSSDKIKLSPQEQELLLRFRRGSKAVPDDKKDLYNRQALDVFDYISKTMRDLDEQNKPK